MAYYSSKVMSRSITSPTAWFIKMFEKIIEFLFFTCSLVGGNKQHLACCPASFVEATCHSVQKPLQLQAPSRHVEE